MSTLNENTFILRVDLSHRVLFISGESIII